MTVGAPGNGTSRATAAVVLGVIATALVMLALSFGSKLPCLGGPYDEQGASPDRQNQNRLYCYSDPQEVWSDRGVAGMAETGSFPYLNGSYQPPEGDTGPVVKDGALEYPVLTGLVIWLAAQPAQDVLRFVAWTVALLAPFAAATAWMLARMSGRRAFLWAAAPSLALYGALNWDLLPVAAVTGAVFAWWRGRPVLGAVLLGLGAAAKIYPGFFLVPLVLERLAAGDRRGAARVAAAGAGAWLAVNLPFMVLGWEGWAATYRFQLARAADLTSNSVYFWLGWGGAELTPRAVDLVSLALVLTSWVVALTCGWRLRTRPGGYPFVQVSAAMLGGFLAFSKVYSPQHILWLLPFFALIRVRWGWWVAAIATDLALFIGVFRWYDPRSQNVGFNLGEQLAMMGGWVKTVLFALLIVVFLTSRTAFGDRPAAGEPAVGGEPEPQTGPGAVPGTEHPPAGKQALA